MIRQRAAGPLSSELPATSIDEPSRVGEDADEDEATDSAARLSKSESKSQRKRDASALQVLGRDLVNLSTARFEALNLPEGLHDAVLEYRRTRSFEGQRRQMQYIGRLMRGVDIEPIQRAVDEQRLGLAHTSLALHEAEAWREELLAADQALTRWVQAHPEDDLQALRQLIRQARSEKAAAQADVERGAPPRKGRAFRALFQHIQARLNP